MKKYLILFAVLLIAVLFSACDKESDTVFTEMNEEVSSLLASDGISNVEKINVWAQMTESQLKRADDFKALIKEEYKKRTDEYAKSGMYENVGITYDDLCKSVDEYFDYLENEYNSNSEFFENQSFALYGTGSAGASYKASKQYECAKSFADKAESFYNELMGGV